MPRAQLSTGPALMQQNQRLLHNKDSGHREGSRFDSPKRGLGGGVGVSRASLADVGSRVTAWRVRSCQHRPASQSDHPTPRCHRCERLPRRDFGVIKRVSDRPRKH
ncbi:hypothetical protein SKAU_G00012720 [Synaphobranchus kaupii]|uniref:Uncharacterized protein n=1 Tax=Synaphobranchus kaupii TaxID=118154 RepID=A0A9Q1GAC4_SYNKA|nr:hypothetical protein SKAU_G00012720 [Synaphobranchus kaupii]